MWEEHRDESEQDQEPQGAIEITIPAAEVVLCLEREDGESSEKRTGDDHGLEHDTGVVERGNNGDGVRFDEGEGREEYQVRRVRLPFPEGGKEQPEGAEHANEEHPCVGLDPGLEGGVEEGDRGEDGSGNQLDGEDRIDFADEGVADVDGCFSNGS